jgi:hypothetical protein
MAMHEVIRMGKRAAQKRNWSQPRCPDACHPPCMVGSERANRLIKEKRRCKIRGLKKGPTILLKKEHMR